MPNGTAGTVTVGYWIATRPNSRHAESECGGPEPAGQSPQAAR